jgi:hypothetical protein
VLTVWGSCFLLPVGKEAGTKTGITTENSGWRQRPPTNPFWLRKRQLKINIVDGEARRR